MNAKFLLAAAVTLMAAVFLGYALFFSGGRVVPDWGGSWLPFERSLNRHVLAAMEEMEGTRRPFRVARGDEYLEHVGILEDIHYQGRRVLRADSPEPVVYCIGVMMELYMRACARAAGDNFTLRQVSSANFGDFRHEWYGTDGNRRTFVDALTRRGLGVEIHHPKDARPGDFVQFWRTTGSGHAVVFLDWTYDSEGLINGITFWSSGGSSGLSEATERIGGRSGSLRVLSDEIYIVRAYRP